MRRAAVWLGIVALPVAVLVVFFAWPTSALITRGIGEILSGEQAELSRIGKVTITTIWLAGAGALGALVLGLPAAWALYRVRWRGQGFFRALVTVPFVLPTVVVALAFRSWLDPQTKTSSALAIIAAMAFFNAAVIVRVVGPVWQRLSVRQYQAAQVLGARPLQTIWYVTWPALRRSIVSSSTIAFLFCTTSFGLVLILGGGRVSTIETEIYYQALLFTDVPTASVLTLVQIVVVVAAFMAASRIRNHASTINSPRAESLSRNNHPWRTALALTPVVAMIAVPLFALVRASFKTRSGYSWDNYSRLLTNRPTGRFDINLHSAAINSLTAAFAAGVIALLIALPLAAAITRVRWLAFLQPLAMAPLGVSSVVVGLGVLITLYPLAVIGKPAVLIPLVQAIVAVPLLTQALTPALREIPSRLQSAAATLGASPWKVWWRVDLPLIKTRLAAAFGLALAVSLGEFGATSFIARPDHLTLPTAISRLLSRPGVESIGMACAAGVILVILTGTVAWLAERLASPSRLAHKTLHQTHSKNPSPQLPALGTPLKENS